MKPNVENRQEFRFAFSLRALLLVVTLFAGGLGIRAWSVWSRTLVISGDEITARQSFELRTPLLLEPTSIILTVKGQIDGEAHLEIMDGMTAEGFVRVGPGKVDEVQRSDFYSTSGRIQYEPASVEKGRLAITYSFGHF